MTDLPKNELDLHEMELYPLTIGPMGEMGVYITRTIEDPLPENRIQIIFTWQPEEREGSSVVYVNAVKFFHTLRICLEAEGVKLEIDPTTPKNPSTVPI